jgi:hypothetical protein
VCGGDVRLRILAKKLKTHHLAYQFPYRERLLSGGAFTMEVLFGPILFIRDVSPENQWAGIVLCVLLIPSMLIGIVRPKPWSIALSVIAALAWLFLGVIGKGINA